MSSSALEKRMCVSRSPLLQVSRGEPQSRGVIRRTRKEAPEDCRCCHHSQGEGLLPNRRLTPRSTWSMLYIVHAFNTSPSTAILSCRRNSSKERSRMNSSEISFLKFLFFETNRYFESLRTVRIFYVEVTPWLSIGLFPARIS